MQHNIFLIDTSYTRGEDGPVVQLYGVTASGTSVNATTTAFRPYFYVLAPTEGDFDWLTRHRKVSEVERVTLEHQGRSRPFFKVYTRMPFDVPSVRDRLRERGREVFAADIPFGLRFMYDTDIGPCALVEGEVEDGKLRMEAIGDGETFDPPLKVMGYDIEQSRHGHILCVSAWMDGEGETFDGTETDILDRLNDYISRRDPDILTGYYSHGYDLPVLCEVSRRTGVPLRWAKDGDHLRQRGDNDFRATGRVLVDALRELQKETRLPKTNIRPERQTLAYVAEYLQIGAKLDVDTTHIDEEWAEDQEKVKTYCLKDAELAVKVLEALGSVPKAVALATASRLPLTNIFDGWNSQLIDSSLIRMCDRRGIAVPCMSHGAKTDRIEGAYVETMPSGLFEYVGVLDVKSMYPSIIKAYNICFTTLLPEGADTRGASVSPIGVAFCSESARRGLLPESLERLGELRAAAKEQYKKTGQEYYNRLQDSIKIVMNATYGVFASDFYRFTNKDIGGSVTAWGREFITKLIDTIRDKEGVKVLYADTDSVFLQCPLDRADANLLCVSLAEKYSQGSISLEYEKLFRRFVSHGKKKRYAAWQILPDEKMVIRGFETRRGDAFPLQKDALNMVFTRLLKEGDVKYAARGVRDVLSYIKRGEANTKELTITRGVRALESYVDPNALPAARAAMKIIAREGPRAFIPGQKVSFIVTKDTSPIDVEPYTYEGQEIPPSYDYYARRILNSVEDLFEVFGYDRDALETGLKQVKLW